ncbi:MAG: hypothetical protein H6953_02850 [Chromatiaceae bacterium]|nr:hypothetical protein [Chromatiaceae bacterium]MCP5314090.1 hypothetical protein [Chromatiaceae bacterium]
MANDINKFLEASLEGAEALADSLIENEVVKNIPVVGTAIKIVSGTLDLREKLFVSKVQRFVQEIECLSKEEKWKFRRSVLSDEESMRRAGEAALLVLDKLSEMKKAELLGFYFACFLAGRLDQIQFRRVAAAIDTAFLDDLEEFLVLGADEQSSQKHYMESLVSSGLTIITAGRTYADSGELFYEASSMGRQVVELWKEFGES